MAETAVKKKISMIPAKAQYDRDVKLTEKKQYGTGTAGEQLRGTGRVLHGKDRGKS